MSTKLVIKNFMRGNFPITGQTQSGYGKKVPTRFMIQIEESKRWYRVYCCIYSNSGVCYIVKQGKSYKLDNDSIAIGDTLSLWGN